MENPVSYEEEFGPVARRMWRVWRGLRWRLKRALGLSGTILVEVRWRLGDEIMTLPVLQALRDQHPRSRILVWCNFPELFKDHPAVDGVNERGPAPDRYILLRGAPRDAYRVAHYALQAGVPTPSARPQLFYEDWTTPLQEELPPEGKPLVAVAPGASWPSKRWPREDWKRLCEALVEGGYAVVEMGVAEEAIGVGVNLVGRTGVDEAAKVLRQARLLVCCDSGLMHLALAAGTPVVALFGPTDPTILIRDEPDLHVLTNERDCRGCWNVSQAMKEPGVCPLGIDPCMGTVEVEEVLAVIASVVPTGI